MEVPPGLECAWEREQRLGCESGDCALRATSPHSKMTCRFFFRVVCVFRGCYLPSVLRFISSSFCRKLRQAPAFGLRAKERSGFAAFALACSGWSRDINGKRTLRSGI